MTVTPEIIPGDIWTAKYETVKVRVIAVAGRSVEFEEHPKPRGAKSLSRAKFLTAFRPPKEQQ